MRSHAEALLALEDGSLFHGDSIGAEGIATGEVVFNTAMTGYQEILTDPSYCRQIVALTHPHVGNTGVNPEDEESHRIFASGLVVRDVPALASNWRSQSSLGAFLERHGVVGVAGIDTRRLTRRLREKGALAGAVVAGSGIDEHAAVAEARAFPGLAGMDLAGVVSVERPYEWTAGPWTGERGFHAPEPDGLPWRVVAYDFGVKRNILRALASRGCRVEVVPAQTPAREVLARSPHGVFLSNGPGDPEPCGYAIDSIRQLLGRGMPVFGICLGHQLLALASGAATMKMKFGHHGANHPVEDPRIGPDPHLQPEPRIRGRGVEPPRQPRRHPPLVVRRHDPGPAPHRRPWLSASRATRRRARGRTIPITCSTASWS